MAIGSSQWMYSSGSEFTIPYSCRFNDDDNAYLSKTFAGAGNLKTWTWSAWIKQGNSGQQAMFGADVGSNALYFESDGVLTFEKHSPNYYKQTSAKFRDPTAWYHIVAVWNTPDSTAVDRMKLYVNGIKLTAFDTDNQPPLNHDGNFNNNIAHNVGNRGRTPIASTNWDGHMAEIHFIDGTALTPSSFGETGDYGEWKPKKVEGLTYGTNGFYLDFADSSALGNDVSGNNNDWAVNNITATDQMLDSPTNNFCTLNILHHDSDHTAIPNATYSEGNLKTSTNTTAGASSNFFGTMGVTSGKWYWEAIRTGGNVAGAFGFSDYDGLDQRTYYGGNGYAYTRLSSASYGASWTTGDIIGIAFDADTQALTFYKNGSTQGTISSALGSGKTYFPMGWDGSGSLYSIFVTNFGQDSSFAGEKTAQGNQDSGGIGDFYYTPPSGFKALCTYNLPAVAVIPNENFAVVPYNGNGSEYGSITDDVKNFPPDFVWIKQRSEASDHILGNRLSGDGKNLKTNSTAVEETDATKFRAFIGNGFQVGTHDDVLEAGQTYVAWNWKAGGDGSANTTGSINSTVSANVDAGFSIVSYTGTGSNATVGHGLSVTPEMIIVKNREDGGMPWLVYHASNTSAPETDYLLLNTGAATTDYHTAWNDTAPTSSVFSVGTADGTNQSSDGHIAYCWHSVDGYSKVGSYEGNSNADGAFVYTGFRPAFIICKQSTGGQAWQMHDTGRDTYNLATKVLFPQANNAEQDSANNGACDILSNGFKWRMGDGDQNGSGETYVYLAIAETPFKYSNAR